MRDRDIYNLVKDQSVNKELDHDEKSNNKDAICNRSRLEMGANSDDIEEVES